MADERPTRRAGRRIRTQRGSRRRSGLIDEGFAAPGAAEAAVETRARRVARARITAALVIALLIVAAAVAATLLPDDDDDTLPPDVAPTTDVGASALVIVEAADGRAASVVLVAAQSGESARMMLFPPALVTVIPGFGERPIADAVRLGGSELVELTITNLLGTRIDAHVALSATELAEVLSGDVPVDLLDPFVVDDGGVEQVLVAEGPQQVDASTAVRLLTDQAGDDQLTWLVRQGAVWKGIAEVIADDAMVLERLLTDVIGAPDVAAQAIGNAVQSDQLLVTSVPVQRIALGEGETYGFDADSPAEVVDGAFPYLALAVEPRIRVEVLSGTDAIGSTRPVAARLIREGYRVLLTDNAASGDIATTQVVAQSREVQESAVAVQRLLGVGEVFLNVDQPSGVVDLTIIVGADLSGA